MSSILWDLLSKVRILLFRHLGPHYDARGFAFPGAAVAVPPTGAAVSPTAVLRYLRQDRGEPEGRPPRPQGIRVRSRRGQVQTIEAEARPPAVLTPNRDQAFWTRSRRGPTSTHLTAERNTHKRNTYPEAHPTCPVDMDPFLQVLPLMVLLQRRINRRRRRHPNQG